MTKIEDNQNKIDRYLLGEMTPSEKTQFEAEMETDSRLKQQFVFFHELQAAARIRDNREQKSQLAHVKAEFLEEQRKKRFRIQVILNAAALLILGGIALYAFMDHPNNPKDENTYSELYAAFFDPSTIRAGGQANDWAPAYRRGDYAEVIRILELKVKSEPLGVQEQDALVIAYIEEDRMEDAILVLESLACEKCSANPDTYEMKLALIDHRKALDRINKIRLKPDHAYRKQADLIYKQWEK